MGAHDQPNEVPQQRCPTHRFLDTAEATAADGDVPKETERNSHTEDGEHDAEGNRGRLGSDSGYEQGSADQFGPWHDNGEKVDRPERDQLVARDGFSELSGKTDFVHAGVDEYPANIESKCQSKILVS